MDEFKPEDEFKPDDELKPDASDRRPSRPRKTSAAPKLPVSRQHMMMGIGILVLLLLVLGIGSALKGPDEHKQAAGNASSASGGGEKNIDLSGATSTSGNPPVAAEGTAANAAPAQGTDVTMPPVAATPTQAAPVATPDNQQRVTLPGDLNSALSNQPQAASGVSDAQSASSLPVAPATINSGLASSAAPVAAQPKPARAPVVKHEPAHRAAARPPVVASESKSKPHATPAHSATGHATANHGAAASSSTAANSGSSSVSGRGLPAGNYTLQLSGASRAESLNAFAKRQNLAGYHVYKTTRNGQPWYVLVSGSYATSAEARRAAAALPAEVRSQNPWVKPVSQVKKEASQ